MAAELLQKLLDEAACQRVLSRYGPAVDWRDGATLASLFWPDAEVDLGVFKGNGAATPAFLLENAARSLRRCHITTNISLHVAGNRAEAESCAITHAITETPSENAGSERFVHVFIGRYLDRLERRGDEWRIAARCYLLHGATTEPYAENPLLNAMTKADALSPLHPYFPSSNPEEP